MRESVATVMGMGRASYRNEWAKGRCLFTGPFP